MKQTLLCVHENGKRECSYIYSVGKLCNMTGVRQRQKDGKGKGKRVSVCNLLLRFGNGRFASSTPISLL